MAVIKATDVKSDEEISDSIITRTITSIADSTVTSIGNYAFNGCSSLTSVNFPEVTSIGRDAFSGCSSLTSVNFPEVTSIGRDAFSHCSSLTSVNFPEVTYIDGNYGSRPFDNCSNLKTINIGSHIRTIGSSALINIPSTCVINLGVAEGAVSGAPWGAPNGVTINYGVKSTS